MAVSKVSLTNKALTLCGATPITSLDDDTNNARIANRVYEISRRSILTECMWSFATTRVTLAVSSESMAWDYSEEAYVYVRPADVLRIFDVSDQYATWRVEGDYILSDTNNLGIKYVYDHDDPSKYPPQFTEAFSDKLCSDISYMIINSAPKAEAFLAKYNTVSLPKAMAENSQIGTQQVPRDDAWDLARLSNGTSDA